MARFAFIFIDGTLETIETSLMNGGSDEMVGVRSVEEACSEAVRLMNDGYDCIELCGAFGEEGAREVIEATGGKVAIGHVVHLPEMDVAYERVFGRPGSKL